jgi:N utilization substance protein B
MINRIIIRVKVLQIVYAYYQKNSKDLVSAENELLFSLEKSYDLYCYLLLLIVLLTDAEQKRLDKNKNKLLATEEELNPNRRMADNRFAEQLRTNSKLTAFSIRKGVLWNDDNSLFVRNLLKKIIRSDYYKEYLESVDSYESDQEFWRSI